VRLFHYHLVTSRVREVEARYLAKLGFELVARYGRVGDEHTSFEPGVPWEELDRLGFKLRLAELERGAVNVVVQPGQWNLPRVDHVGIAMDEEDFTAALAAPTSSSCASRNTAAAARSWRRAPATASSCIRRANGSMSCSRNADVLTIAELQLKADDPHRKAESLAELLEIPHRNRRSRSGETVLRFVDGGPAGRPELHAELFV
jgi:hypothetical protein